MLLLRGNGIALRPEGMSLFRDVAEKLGIAVEGAAIKTRSSGGFSSFRELFDHLHSRWKQDRVPDRRLVLILDALNEAPYADKVIREALDLIGLAACYPWCKVIVSTRQEWLSLWNGKLGANEPSPLEELRPFLYVIEPGNRPERRTAPVVQVEPFTEAQASAVYGRYQAATGREDYHTPACRTPWSELPAGTRGLLLNPVYLHLFMETFDGQTAEPVLTVPALFRRYVEKALCERPGLGTCIEAVVDHSLQELGRPSADLSDDDCNAIRRVWAEGRSVEETRLELSPVEGLAHEGLIAKRVREEGGGYRFTFQIVTEYLIYCRLARACGEGDEVFYWAGLANPVQVFPEYAGAFAFILRDWMADGKLVQAAVLFNVSRNWLHNIRTTFLVEQAYAYGAAGSGSQKAEALAGELGRSGGGLHVEGVGLNPAWALVEAAAQLTGTPLASVAASYLKASVSIIEKAWWFSQMTGVGAPFPAGVPTVLRSVGEKLLGLGRGSEADTALRLAIEMCEKRKQPTPGDGAGRVRRLFDWARSLFRRQQPPPGGAAAATELGGTLTGLANLLAETGREAEAEETYHRALDVLGPLWASRPDDTLLGLTLADTLDDVGSFLSRTGSPEEAVESRSRALGVYDTLVKFYPQDIEIALGRAKTLVNLANSLSSLGQRRMAEEYYRMGIDSYERDRAAWPEQAERVERLLAQSLNNLGLLFMKAGRYRDAEPFFRRSADAYEAAWRTHPQKTDIGDALGDVLGNLGNTLQEMGCAREADEVFRRGLAHYRALAAADPANLRIRTNFALALHMAGQTTEAMRTITEVVDADPADTYANKVKRYIGSSSGP